MHIGKSLNSAIEHYQSGDFRKAESICRKVLKKRPENADALHFLGVICSASGQHDLAIDYIKRALQIDPNFADAYNNLGNVFQKNKRPDEAISCYQKALNLNPKSAITYYNLGVSLQDKGRLDEAIVHYRKALQFNFNSCGLFNNLGLALQNKGHLDEAINCYQNAIRLDPGFAEAYYNLGNVIKDKQQLDEAVVLYQKALQLNPEYADAYNNLGIVLREKGQLDEAISCFRNALQLNPNFADAYSNLGDAFQEKGQLDEAVITCCKKALEINPDQAEAYCQLTYQMQRTCNWQELKVMAAKLDGLTEKALAAGVKPAETPFMNITRNADASMNFAVAKSWSRDIAETVSVLKMHFSFDLKRRDKSKIVIGYLSNDFGNHATAHLMLSLFGLHSRDEFEIMCYSYGKDDGSCYRARIQHDCDKFVDISNLNYDAAARCINENQVDILVDLKGHTRGSRLAICALRPAPVQVSYLGFPGTTGADFFDYIVSDKIVTSEDQRPFFAEKVVYMPHCYQVNDHTQLIADKEWKKADIGLPEGCFAFCSFNQAYKIDPLLFDSWMRILEQVPESILWLGFGNKIVRENMRSEAEARGVNSERLIFGEMLMKDEHLSRLRLADLALDTRIVNGHTTTSDALWAGIPVITLQGSHFASRVSSSILSAMGLPQLITNSMEEYEALAVRLAGNPVELQEIRQKIAESRLTTPLFDTPRFVKNLETAYKQMWKIYLAGEEPREIEVLESY
jgi:protein O-GlcNAc transferase